MKKIIMACAISLFICASANASPFLFDPDGSFGPQGTYKIDEFSGEINGLAPVTQFLGSDGVFNDGDRFLEDFNINIKSLNLTGITQYAVPTGGTPVSYALVGNAAGIGGYVTGHDDGGTPTTWDDINIIDDDYTVMFDIGSVDFVYDATPGVAGGLSLIAQFDVTGGEARTYNPGSTFTSDIEINLVASLINAGWFFSTTGQDWSTLPADQLVIAVADNSVNLEGFAGTQGVNGGEDFLTFLADDNGTDIEFNAVPEPATMLLFGAGLIGLAGIGRRKRS